MKALIKDIWEGSYKPYGRPKIAGELARKGHRYSLPYVARLMKQMGIRSRAKQRFVATTDSRHEHPVCENLLDRKFAVDELGKAWVSDITYIRSGQGWLYLTTVIDLADRQVVGWSLSRDMTVENTVYRAWINARNRRGTVDGFIFHSDRGVQYACNKMSGIFSAGGKMNQSMSRKGNCWDNAVAESFFRSIKCELVYLHKWDDYGQAYRHISRYIHWYNTKRIHQGLGYITPLEREQELRNKYCQQAA